VSLEKIRDGWATGRLCERVACNRATAHYSGEYGCLDSDVWQAPSWESFGAVCPSTKAEHRRGCGCDGDPTAHCSN